MLELKLYKNNDQASRYFGKTYARVDLKRTYSVHDLSHHMSEHNTPFSEGTIEGILTDMVKCIRELTLNGNTVKINNLAIFKCSVEANPIARPAIARAAIGPVKAKDPKTGQMTDTGNAVRNIKLTAQATGDYTRAELNKDGQLGWTDKARAEIEADKQEVEPEP